MNSGVLNREHFCLSKTVEDAEYEIPKADLQQDFVGSPKVVIIVGQPAAGKGWAARQLEERFGYARISLDAVNQTVMRQTGRGTESLKDPSLKQEFVKAFDALLRRERYRNIVTEGCRFTAPHILQAFEAALATTYGPYVIVERFFLDTPDDKRYEQYLQRKARATKELVLALSKGSYDLTTDAAKHLLHAATKPLDTFKEIIPQQFQRVQSTEEICEWAEKNQNQEHSCYPQRWRELLCAIANSRSYNPFYQTITIGSEVVIPGATNTARGWERLSALGIEWRGRSVCEVGCNHGYYLFRAEERGAQVTGYDINAGAIDVCRAVAQASGSRGRFAVKDCVHEDLESFDLILTLSTLHRVSDYDAVLSNILAHAKELVLEVTQAEVPRLLAEVPSAGFQLVRQMPSRDGEPSTNRTSVREILHFRR